VKLSSIYRFSSFRFSAEPSQVWSYFVPHDIWPVRNHTYGRGIFINFYNDLSFFSLHSQFGLSLPAFQSISAINLIKDIGITIFLLELIIFHIYLMKMKVSTYDYLINKRLKKTTPKSVIY